MNYDLVIIDSGFDSISSDIPDFIMVDFFEFESGKLNKVDKTTDETGHGTSVLSLIISQLGNSPKRIFQKVSIAFFKIHYFNKDASYISSLLTILEYIKKHIKAKIINMSFGVRGYSKKLENLCCDLYMKKTLVISALDNFGAMSYPAAFDFCIGVKGNKHLAAKSFKVFTNNIVDCEAKVFNSYNKLNKNFNWNISSAGSSFAAAYVTAYLLKKMLYERAEITCKEDALRILAKTNTFSTTYKDYSCTPNLLKKNISIFPLNKENYNVINNCHLLACNLINVYDSKYLGQVGKTITSFKGEEYTICNIDNLNLKNIDWMILGHCSDIEMLTNKKYKQYILLKCLNEKVNVFCYDSKGINNRLIKQFAYNGLKLIVADNEEYVDLKGYFYQIKTPILEVLGTSSHQGKFTLQQQVISILKQKGFNVGFLGTEPNSILFGADECFAYGYSSSYKELNENKFSEFVNRKLHLIDKKEKDIIVTGGQSLFLPHPTYGKMNSNFLWARQFPFLLGSNPDCVILCVNIFDEIDYISRTITAIETISNTKVIMLSLYRFSNNYDHIINNQKKEITTDEFNNFRNSVSKRLNLPIIISGDSSFNDVILKTILNAFA